MAGHVMWSLSRMMMDISRCVVMVAVLRASIDGQPGSRGAQSSVCRLRKRKRGQLMNEGQEGNEGRN